MKSLLYLYVDKLETQINAKLDANLYVIDNQLKNSNNPVANSVIKTKFDSVDTSLSNKSNVGHVHNISEINSLSTSIDSKADATDVTNHINNRNNLYK